MPHDYLEPLAAIAATIHHGIKGSKWVLFEQSGHEAHIEEPERYIHVLDEFLGQREAQE